MKDINRRGFLGTLVAAPVAASSALKRAVGQQSVLHRSLGGCGDNAVASTGGGREAWEVFAQHGVPEWKLARVRENSKVCPSVAPDIDALRSVSWSAKLRMQGQRNFDREIAELSNDDPWRKARDAWLKKYRLDWA